MAGASYIIKIYDGYALPSKLRWAENSNLLILKLPAACDVRRSPKEL